LTVALRGDRRAVSPLLVLLTASTGCAMTVRDRSP
jgi:hypothetical protein